MVEVAEKMATATEDAVQASLQNALNVNEVETNDMTMGVVGSSITSKKILSKELPRESPDASQSSPDESGVEDQQNKADSSESSEEAIEEDKKAVDQLTPSKEKGVVEEQMIQVKFVNAVTGVRIGASLGPTFWAFPEDHATIHDAKLVLAQIYQAHEKAEKLWPIILLFLLYN